MAYEAVIAWDEVTAYEAEKEAPSSNTKLPLTVKDPVIMGLSKIIFF